MAAPTDGKMLGAGAPVLPLTADVAEPKIHEAELVSGPSGAVQYGMEIGESTAVARRRLGRDIVVRGENTQINRACARRIESQVGPPSRPQFPHTASAGPEALPHFHQMSRSPGGHGFYETDRRKARKKP